MSPRHPYTRFVGTPEWAAVDRAVQELAGNKDLVEATSHEYIVGYLCKALVEHSGIEHAPNDAASGQPQGFRPSALNRVRKAVRTANTSNRDLVKELHEERRLESARD